MRSLLPPRTCLHFHVSTAHRFSSNVANSRFPLIKFYARNNPYVVCALGMYYSRHEDNLPSHRERRAPLRTPQRHPCPGREIYPAWGHVPGTSFFFLTGSWYAEGALSSIHLSELFCGTCCSRIPQTPNMLNSPL